MAKENPKPKCFIIMPVSTPEDWVKEYQYDKDHFKHVLEFLFIPVIESAGFDPIRPTSEGSTVILADIINHLSTTELVLCDMSIWNPNVFFEFGIRTALNKPVALVKDEKMPNLPFDTSPIQCHPYDSSLAPWKHEEQTKLLLNHMQNTYKKSPSHNPLWKTFGIQPGNKPEPAKVEEKIDFLIEQFRNMRTEPNPNLGATPFRESGIFGFSGSKKPNFVDQMYDYAAKLQIANEFCEKQKLVDTAAARYIVGEKKKLDVVDLLIQTH
jgi:hypothetical protein